MDLGIWFAIIAGMALVIMFLATGYRKLRNKLEDKRIELSKSNERYSRLLSQKKSSEVRLGKIAENMAPFFDAWPYDPNNFRFLGNPIDGIQFSNDGVIFMEIKSGKARLTSSQKTVKKLVKEGKVYFATFRVAENGCLLKVEEDDDDE